ncbi:MAG: TIM barrel protein [Clostridia bacterium]|nr:TIM barrel protein [Clostridia bacterium]
MIKFGPSGNSIAFTIAGNKTSEQSALWVKNMGLDCFEYSFGRGVNMTDERALSIGNAFANAGIEISVHAPYYINLANPEEDKANSSFNYIIDSAKKAKLLGGKRIVFHPASQGKLDRETAVNLTIERLKHLTDIVYQQGLDDMIFCPETMGKLAQIGTIEEITSFCAIDNIYTPCVDFGHVNAREQGSLKTTLDYQDRLDYMTDKLGHDRVKNFHIHFSKIEYTIKGEVRHLTFEDKVYGPDFTPLAIALKERKLTPYIICESAGTQDIDALNMKNIYNSI